MHKLAVFAAAVVLLLTPPTAAAQRVPPGFEVLQGAVFPKECRGLDGGIVKEGLDLDSHPLTELKAKDHVLSTALAVSVNPGVIVPNYSHATLNDPLSPWQCTTSRLDLRNYVDPVTGKVAFPGPTLRITRASELYQPGDRIEILLENRLPPSDGDCIWAGHGCGECVGQTPPECCQLIIRPKGMNCFHGENSTNIHFHGMHVSPQRPQDWVLLQLHPPELGKPVGSCDGVNCYGQFQYHVDPVRDHQSEGTHWYHPHKHGSTAAQLGNGMAGAIIVEGPFDVWLQGQFKGRLRERTMVVQQIHDLNFTSRAPISGEIPMINGLLMPSVTMYPGEIQRWRFVSATMEASAQIAIDFNSVANTPVQVKQIAMDGVRFSDRNYQCQPLLNPGPTWTCTGFPPDPKFYLSPGNRADFLVRAPDAVGRYMISYDVFGAVDRQGLDTKQPRGGRRRDLKRARQLTREVLDAIAPGDLQPALLSIRVVPCPAGQTCNRMEFPPKLPPMPDFLKTIVPTDPGHNLQFQIVNEAPDPPTLLPPPPAPNALFGVRLQGRNRMMQFQEDCAALTLPLNPRGGQKWDVSQNVNTIVVKSGVPGAPLHVFHMHTNPFQVVSTFVKDRKITYPEPIWMDSVAVPNNRQRSEPGRPSGQVEIRQRFEDFTGQFVLHCHFLGHEDRGMMLSVQTVCPMRNEYSVTSPNSQECVAGEYLPALPPCP